MFKHLTRISAANQVRASTQTVQLANCALMTQARLAAMRNVPLKQNLFQRIPKFSFATKQRDLGSVIPDYATPDFMVQDNRTVTLSEEQVKDKHPIDYAVQHGRKLQDYLAQITLPTEFMIFNLPDSITKEKITNLLTSDKSGIHVMNVAINRALNNNKPSFAYVKVGTVGHVKIAKDRFKNLWVEDKKLKLKTRDELTYETFDHRTIVVEGIPNHFKERHLLKLFEEFGGSITGIELPTKNIAIEEEIRQKLTEVVKAKQQEREIEYRRAQALVQESVKENEQYYREMFTKAYGAQEADQILLQLGNGTIYQDNSAITKLQKTLDSQRQLSIQSMIHQLQSEGVEVTKARKVLLNLRDQASDEVPSIGGGKQFDEMKEQIIQNKSLLANTVNYINKNREHIDENTLSLLNEKLLLSKTGTNVDPIQNLQNLSQQELALAYDHLIGALNQRETLIEERIKAQINYLGKDERILFEQKDWSKELEDLKPFNDPFGNSAFKAEDIISVNEQVHNVVDLKNLSVEDRFARIVQNQLNPFLDTNFNEQQISGASQSNLTSDERIPSKPFDINKAPSLNQQLFEGYTLTEGTLEAIQAQISELRDQLDLPFDELYQKERKLVDAVIRATEGIRKKEALLPSPITEDRLYQPSELKGTYNLNGHGRETFLRDQRRKASKVLNDQIDSAGASQFEFKINSTENMIDQYLEQGLIGQRDYDEFSRWITEAQEVNLGYAFVTFSHSDEAKIALILGQNILADNVQLELTNKLPEIDHKDFDFQYQINKNRNEAKLTEELKALRESRKELRDFEKNIDKDLPSLKKLKDFRETAKDVIDGKRSYKGALLQRTQREEQDLMDKIRQLQKDNPDKDYTQLFQTERAELLRKQEHKKAFASYKAFQFLKHGVELHSRGVTETKKDLTRPAPYQVNDPYEFPLIQDTVSTLMPKDELYPRVLDAGDRLDQQPGRKFAYTNDDFIRAYFGKDYARSVQVQSDDSNLYRINESLDRKYPIDKYVLGPQLEAKRKLLEDRMQVNDNINLQEYAANLDIEGDTMYENDVPHPSGDKSRSLVRDANKRLENYMARREKIAQEKDQPVTWNTKEVAYIRKALREEYFPKPKEEKGADDTKQEEKFEPFFEGGSDAPVYETTATTDAAPQQQERQHRPQRHSGKGGKPYRGGNQQRKEQNATEQQKKQVNPLLERLESDPMNSGVKEPVELEWEEAQVSRDQRVLNREFIYDYKYRNERDARDRLQLNTQKIEKFAVENGMTLEEALEHFKDIMPVGEFNTRRGYFENKDRFGLKRSELDVQSRQRAVRSIQDFAGAAQDTTVADLSEREDEDIYQHYMEQMQKAKAAGKDGGNLKQSKEALGSLEGLMSEVPRFEGFFNSMAQGKHPLDQEHDEHPSASTEKQEQEYDEELYRRELRGRLLGETLSPKQFSLLFEASIDKQAKVRMMKGQDRQQFINDRDCVRLGDEAREAARRRNVMQGKWTEEESHEAIRQLEREEAAKEHLDARDNEQRLRDFVEQRQLMSYVIGDEEGLRRRMEKEYYFDEGLGESLQEHIEDLKQRFPELAVETRRDRDGFAIVKTKFAPKYKYDVEKAMKFDVVSAQERMKESMEDIQREYLGVTSLDSVDGQQLEQKLSQMLKNQKNEYLYDQESQDAIKKLWDERLMGRYAEDRQGFTRAYFDLQSKAKVDKSKKAPLVDTVDASEVIRGILEDREQMYYEVALQASSRAKQHMFLKERTDADLVTPRRSEIGIFERQKQSNSNAMSNLEQQVARMAEKEGDQAFDKEAYQRLKAEIKQRREAKERLLQQGFPELKPYVTI